MPICVAATLLQTEHVLGAERKLGRNTTSFGVDSWQTDHADNGQLHLALHIYMVV